MTAGYAGERGDFTLVLAGELLVTRSFRGHAEERFTSLVELLHSGDATFGNLEMLFHDFEGAPAEVSRGSHMRAAPALLSELRWMGFDLVATAMNHAADYGHETVLTNLAHVARAGLVAAGTGADLDAARAPAYCETPSGRVALVAATDHVNVPAARAARARWDVKGRPGANLIRVTPRLQVGAALFDRLVALDDDLGFRAERERLRMTGRFPLERLVESGSVLLFGPGLGAGTAEPLRFVRDETLPRDRHALVYDVDRADWEANLASIREARRMADTVVFSLHCGFNGTSADDPPDHLVRLAHEAADAGADLVVSHGRHRDKGIEIYRGVPILYSLGDFFLETDTIAAQPWEGFERYGLNELDAPLWAFYETRSRGRSIGQDVTRDKWETFVARVSWRDGVLAAVEVIPVDLRMGASTAQRGRPMLADGEVAESVLARLARCSARFGTTLRRGAGGAQVELEGSRE